MKRRHGDGPFRRGVRGALAGLAVAVLLPWTCACPAQVVIAHASLGVDSVSPAVLRAVFSMRLQSLRGQRLTVFVLDPRSPVHERFSKEVLGVFPYQLQHAWNRAVFSGTGAAPMVLGTEAEMLRRVAETAGAIGYVSAPPERPGIRVLKVEETE
ncbi:hypothetical protein [Ectothiorhodospira mobilis]|uniref:hypothetical protein n=1 Tax=Ectothiorhodospira mobilis TaxID=195064 RepID=UPI001908E080|nr:hypothetical protein [Ectothiorhodospira mobilis]MBK1692488.1 hypothetical protein [Ectothiorhodospira mobilis]